MNNPINTLISKMKQPTNKEGMGKLYYSSYLFLITSLYALYNKLYTPAILTFYLFITSNVYWNDYNNNFKLCSDHYIIFIVIFYALYESIKIKYYKTFILLTYLFSIYIISYIYSFKNNYTVSSNLWIFTHFMIASGLILLFNKMKTA